MEHRIKSKHLWFNATLIKFIFKDFIITNNFSCLFFLNIGNNTIRM
jgi:hypothetical protein